MYENFIIEKNKNFIRLTFEGMTLEDLYKILTDPSFSMFFIVFKYDNHIERFRINKPENLDSFINKVGNILYNREDSGIDSDSFNIYDAEYIDCYPI